MSEDERRSEGGEKRSKKLHVDTLHIHADRVIWHQEQTGPEHGPEHSQEGIQRDFWGFPVRDSQHEDGGREEGDGGENEGSGGPPPGPWI